MGATGPQALREKFRRSGRSAVAAWGAAAKGLKIAHRPFRSTPMEELLIVTTGGTIDKIYFDDKSDYQVGDPQIGQILRELGVAFRFSVIPIVRKDSLHLTSADRELIRAAIAAQPAAHVLITHGTDTMVDTARALASIEGKTIVLTGALNPARFRGSDAEFNIGCAVGAVQSLPPGVYIAMNGRIWNPNKVRKNVAANRFEAAE
jgi:L-asparaginase